MSLSAPHVTSRSIGPFGYSSGRVNGHYQPVLPTSKSSMHLNLHKGVPLRIRPHSVLDNSQGMVSGLKLLDKQRPKMKRFIGIKFSVTSKEQQELSSRLASYNPLRFPAESRGVLPPIDDMDSGQRVTYKYTSYTEEEVKRLVHRVTEGQNLSEVQVQGIVDRLATKPKPKKNKSSKDGKDDENEPKRFSAGQVKKLVDRLAAYDPETEPAQSRGKPTKGRDLSDLLKPAKVASSSEVKAIVERLSQYNPKKWPPGSRDDEESNPAAASNGKKVLTEGEVEQIVNRLASYDKKKWPPESVGMKEEFYQGKPLKFTHHLTTE